GGWGRAGGRGPPERGRRFYHALARAGAARGETELAAEGFLTALNAARRLHAGWTDAPSREAFVKSQERLLADARAFFEQEGMTREVEELAEVFLSPEAVRRRRQEQLNRRHHLLGLLLALPSLAAGLAGLGGVLLGYLGG